MKSAWKTLILVAVVGGLGYYTLKVDKAPPSEEDSKKPQLFDAKEESFTLLRVERAAGKLSFERKDVLGEWRMNEPKAFPANPDEVKTLLSTFENFRAERSLEIPVTELSLYGLAPASLSVEASGAAVTLAFKAGGKDPSDTYRYVMKEGKVYLASSYLFDRFEKAADEYRSRDLIQFDKSLAEKIRYHGRGRSASLEKAGDAWTLKDPPKVWKISDTAVDGLLNQVANLKVKTFVEDNPKNTGPYGFKAGDQEVVVKVKGGAEYRVQFGSKLKDKDEVYIRTGAGPGVNTTTSTWPDNIFKDPLDLRDKAVFDVAAGDLNELTVTGGGLKARFERTGKPEAEGTDKTWVAVEPAGNTAAAAKGREIAEELAWLRVSDFLAGKQPVAAKSGMEKPAFEVSFKGLHSGKAVAGSIRLGAPAPEASTIYASASPVEAVFSLPNTLLNLCQGLSDVLKPPPPPSPVPTVKVPPASKR